eukprot:1148707-Pelagomonas_calceolata.AAC.6
MFPEVGDGGLKWGYFVYVLAYAYLNLQGSSLGPKCGAARLSKAPELTSCKLGHTCLIDRGVNLTF